MTSPTWEQSVAKARLAGMKTFEGRLEIARASFDQIPPNGKGAKHKHTLATFAEEAGLEYQAVDEYRQFAKWWGDFLPQQEISYTTAREAQRSKRWANGLAFVTFTFKSDPPEGFTTWTLDALREHLGKAMTNTGKVAKRLREGENVTANEEHAAKAVDHAVEAGEEVAAITSDNDKLRAGVEASKAITDKLPVRDPIFDEIDAPPPPYEEIARLVVSLEAHLSANADWMKRHGSKDVEGEPWSDIAMDSLAESKGRLDIAFRSAGVGVDLDTAAETILG